MKMAKIQTAKALSPMLSTFATVNGQHLRAAWQFYTHTSLDKLVLDFDQMSLTIEADEDDDSIDIALSQSAASRETGAVDASQLEPWKDLIGKPFGWGWITVNQQGFSDGLLLSFGGIIPQIILSVIASSIKAGMVTGL